MVVSQSYLSSFIQEALEISHNLKQPRLCSKSRILKYGIMLLQNPL